MKLFIFFSLLGSYQPIDSIRVEGQRLDVNADEILFLKKEMFNLVEKEKAVCEGLHSFYAQALVELLMRYEVCVSICHIDHPLIS
mgnify:CR=1 FL=1